MITRRRFLGLSLAAIPAALLAPLTVQSRPVAPFEPRAFMTLPEGATLQAITINKHNYAAVKIESAPLAHSDIKTQNIVDGALLNEHCQVPDGTPYQWMHRERGDYEAQAKAWFDEIHGRSA